MSPDALELEAVSGRLAGRRLAPRGSGIELGRGSGEEGGLGDDPELSRRHARISTSDEGLVVVEDLGSTNGTFLNGERIGAPKVLRPGDTLSLGGTTFQVVEARTAAEPAQAEDPPSAPKPAPIHGGVHTFPTDLLPLLVSRAPVRREWIVRAFLSALPIVIAVNFFARTIAVEYLGVDPDIDAMRPYVLFFISLMPTLGNCIGFYANFGRPANRSTIRYLAPTFAITVVITTIDLILLPADAGAAEYAVTIFVSAVAPTVIVPMLLGLRVRAALRAERELGRPIPASRTSG